MPTLETHNGYPLWHYIPSIVAAIIFAILFFVVTTYHVWRLLRSKAWFCVPFCIGGLFEIIGYGGRASAYDKTGALLPYIIQSIFILLGPILMAASTYMLLGCIVTRTEGEAHSLIRARWLTRIFVGFDVFSFLIQSSGAGLMIKAGSMSMGRVLIVAGLILQVVAFGVFIITGLLFYRRMRKVPTRASQDYHRWSTVIKMMFGVSFLILTRSIFRVVEYAMGNDGYLLGHEWTLYVFDTILVFGAMVIFGIYHPGQIRKVAAHMVQDELRSDVGDGKSMASEGAFSRV